MSGTPLDGDVIESLLVKDQLQHGKTWSVQEDTVKALVPCFSRQETFAVIKGRRFVVSYKGERAYVKPEEGYVPCGWFSYREYVKFYG